jgi:hypothetical protein
MPKHTKKKRKQAQSSPKIDQEEEIAVSEPRMLKPTGRKVPRLKNHDARIFWQHHLKQLLLRTEEKISSSETFLDFSAKCKYSSFSLKLLESLSVECLERENKDAFQGVQAFYRAIMLIFKSNHEIRVRFAAYVLRLTRHFKPIVNSSYEIQLFLFKQQQQNKTSNTSLALQRSKKNPKQVLPLSIVLQFLFATRNPFFLDQLLVEVDSEFLDDPKAQRIPSTFLLPSPQSSSTSETDTDLKFEGEIKLEEEEQDN